MSEDKPGSSSTASIVGVVVAVVLFLFCTVVVLGVGGLFLFGVRPSSPVIEEFTIPEGVEVEVTPIPEKPVPRGEPDDSAR